LPFKTFRVVEPGHHCGTINVAPSIANGIKRNRE